VALDAGTKTDLLPLKCLWSSWLERDISTTIHEDNSAAIVITQKGFSAALRYVCRTQRVSLAWLAEVLKRESIGVDKIDSKDQKADGFTKEFNGVDWQGICMLLGIVMNSPPVDG
jgi:hypothetical protein